jgi:hypothetical protein
MDALAANHRRTVRAIESRLEKLGLIQASDRTADFEFRARTPRSLQVASGTGVPPAEQAQPTPK